MEKELVAVCTKFLKEHQVRAPESCYQMDDVVLAAPELVQAVADVIGYYDDETGELDRSKEGDPRTPEFGVGS